MEEILSQTDMQTGSRHSNMTAMALTTRKYARHHSSIVFDLITGDEVWVAKRDMRHKLWRWAISAFPIRELALGRTARACGALHPKIAVFTNQEYYEQLHYISRKQQSSSITNSIHIGLWQISIYPDRWNVYIQER